MLLFIFVSYVNIRKDLPAHIQLIKLNNVADIRTSKLYLPEGVNVEVDGGDPGEIFYTGGKTKINHLFMLGFFFKSLVSNNFLFIEHLTCKFNMFLF